MYCVVVTDARNSSRSVGMRSSAPDGRRTFRSRAAWMFKSKRDHQREVSAFIARPPVNSRRVAFRLASSPRGAGEASHSTGETHHRNGDIRLSDEFANRPANDSLYIGNSRSSRGPPPMPIARTVVFRRLVAEDREAHEGGHGFSAHEARERLHHAAPEPSSSASRQTGHTAGLCSEGFL